MEAFERTRSTDLGPSARPVAIPDGVDAPGVAKARGVVELPVRVRWSGPPRRYDLDRRRDRALVYEQVLAEGTHEDIGRFVDVDQLIELWPDLVLPRHVRDAWTLWLRDHRSIDVTS